MAGALPRLKGPAGGADAQLGDEARRSRPGATVIQCALAAEPGSLDMRFGDLMSSVADVHDATWSAAGVSLGWRDPDEMTVRARRLSDLLDEVGAPEVGLLSLDIEGFEAQALGGLDLERHAPRYVLVEIHDRERNQPPIDAVLGERYAEHGWLSPNDLLYVRRDVG